MGKDYYKILGINNDADYQTIKSAYRNLIKKYHPNNYNYHNQKDNNNTFLYL